MADYSKLASLLGNKADINPDIDDPDLVSQKYPQYEQMLQNARDEIVKNQVPAYINNMGKNPAPIDAGNRPNRTEPNFLDKAATDESTRPYLNYLHDKNSYLSDPNNTIPRYHIFNQLAKDYVQTMHPEMLANMRATQSEIPYGSHLTNMDGGNITPEKAEMLNYHRQIGKELTGVEPKDVSFSNEPRYNNDLADYNPGTDAARLSFPFLFSPTVHEFMHKADRTIDPGYYRQHEILDNDDLKNSQNLATDLSNINNRHILGYLPEQNLNDKPVGEGSVYFKKIKELLGK